jgi:alkylated DNA repair dioxygenase AlkB
MKQIDAGSPMGQKRTPPTCDTESVPLDLPLFGTDLPEGFDYRETFITPEEEASLVAEIGRIEFSTFEMRGVIAKRRVAFFGQPYTSTATDTPPMPAFLFPFCARAAAWAGVDDDEFAMALINEYQPGAPIGWHRDAPQYEMIAGISLLSACRMKLRPYVAPSAAKSRTPRKTTAELTLAARSGYLIGGVARREYEHSIPLVATLRYSITFRTLRRTR